MVTIVKINLRQKSLLWNVDKCYIFILWNYHDIQFFFFLWKENKFQGKDDTILLMFGFECLTGQKYATEKYAGTKKRGI